MCGSENELIHDTRQVDLEDVIMKNEEQFVMVRLPLSDIQTRVIRMALSSSMKSDQAFIRMVREVGTLIPPCEDVKTFLRAIMSGKSLVGMIEPDSKREIPDVFEDIPLVRRTDMEAQAEVSEALIRGLKSEIAGYRKALNDISENITCGCMPCMGNCWDKDSLRDEISERAEIARTALKEGSAA